MNCCWLAEREARVGRRDFRLAHQEEVDVVGRQRVVERRLDRRRPGAPAARCAA